MNLNYPWLRTIFQRGIMFDEIFATCEDLDFYISLRQANIPIYYMNDILVEWYEQALRITLVTEQTLIDRDYFFRKHQQFFKKELEFAYSFLKTFAKHALQLRSKYRARKYFWEAYKIKPWRIELLGKIIKGL